jgi:mRNA interferase RelE/StbE
MATWKIEVSALADRQLDKLDSPIARRIERFLQERVAKLKDPRSIGEALRGSRLGEFWKYRVDDWRIICDIQDEKLTILALQIGHRREVYSR